MKMVVPIFFGWQLMVYPRHRLVDDFLEALCSEIFIELLEKLYHICCRHILVHDEPTVSETEMGAECMLSFMGW